MAFNFERLLDATGRQLLRALQENARLSYSELGRQVGLSVPAVADTAGHAVVLSSPVRKHGLEAVPAE